MIERYLTHDPTEALFMNWTLSVIFLNGVFLIILFLDLNTLTLELQLTLCNEILPQYRKCWHQLQHLSLSLLLLSLCLYLYLARTDTHIYTVSLYLTFFIFLSFSFSLSHTYSLPPSLPPSLSLRKYLIVILAFSSCTHSYLFVLTRVSMCLPWESNPPVCWGGSGWLIKRKSMDAVWILSGKILVASPPITQRLSAPVKSFRGGKEKAKQRLIM